MRRLSKSIQTRFYIGHVKFFRSRLLVLDSDGISKMIDAMEKETQNIRLDVLKLCWYMRGGVTYDEAMQMSQTDHSLINDIVKENLETTKKSGLPFF